MADQIQPDKIEKGIPAEFRPYFQITSPPLPASMGGLVESFHTAVKAILPAIWFNHPAHIVFGTAPWKISFERGKMTYETAHPDIINVHMEQWVFLDCNRMKKLQPEFQVACVLEELVRVLMHVSDDKLVPAIVSYLYPKVRIVDGKYSVAK